MTTQHPKLIVLAGPNGAGKSTTAPALLRDALGVSEFVNADTIARGLSGFAPELAAFAAGRIMVARIRELSAARRDFAFETTLATRAFAPWIAGLNRSGYEFHILYLWLPTPEAAIARVQERVRLGGHDVPEPVVRRRFGRGLRNFFSLYRPLAVRWRFYDNSGARAPRLIARGGRSTGPGGSPSEVVLDPGLWARVKEVAHA